MARPSKPALSAEEWEAIAGKGDRAASGIVSAMRGANLGSITQAEAGRRRVSHEWVAQARKRQKTQPSENQVGAQETMPSENQLLTDRSGPRMGYSAPPVESPGENAGVQQTESRSPAKDQVVAKGGA